MMGNLARALDERHKVMHSSGESQDTTAQAIRPYNHNNTTTDTGPPQLASSSSGRRCLHQNSKVMSGADYAGHVWFVCL